MFRFVYITTKRARWGRWNFLTILKDWLSRCKRNKRKTIAPHIIQLMCFLLWQWTISLQLVPSHSSDPPSLLVFTSFYICSLTKTMPRKFQGSGESWFGGFEKIRIFWRFQNGSINLFGNASQESWFLIFKKNAVKTRSYGLKISEIIEIKYVFQSKGFFSSQ